MYDVLKASTDSPDPSTQNAAALYNDDAEHVAGPFLNAFPDGVRSTPERWESRPDKYYFVEHAERAAIIGAARYGICTHGLTLVCPFFACADCARAILGAGIKRVVGLPLVNVNERWVDSCNTGNIILKEGGVEVITLDTYFGISVRRNGHDILL